MGVQICLPDQTFGACSCPPTDSGIPDVLDATAGEAAVDAGADSAEADRTNPPLDALDACSSPQLNCSGRCVDPAHDPMHCGECGRACSGATNATPACGGGRCGFVCEAGFGDCNASRADGCETSTRTDANNCGACGSTCTGGAPCVDGMCGRPPNRFSLSPSGGYVDVGDFDFLGDFTVLAWIRPAMRVGAVIGKYDGTEGGFEININDTTGRILVHTRAMTELYSPAPVALDTWTHVAFTYSAGVGTLYLNGTMAASAMMPAPVDNANRTRIGRSTHGGNSFPGLIDEVAVYGRSLSAAEITARMSRRLDPPTEMSLRAYWPFEEGTGTTTSNAVGGGFNGTLSAASFSSTVPFP